MIVIPGCETHSTDDLWNLLPPREQPPDLCLVHKDWTISCWCLDNLWPWRQQSEINVVLSKAALHRGRIDKQTAPDCLRSWSITCLHELCVLCFPHLRSLSRPGPRARDNVRWSDCKLYDVRSVTSHKKFHSVLLYLRCSEDGIELSGPPYFVQLNSKLRISI